MPAPNERLPRPVRDSREIPQRDLTGASEAEIAQELAAFETRLRDWAAQLESIDGGGDALVSVEVPVYKGGWLMPCLESVLFQTSTCWSLWMRWDSGDEIAKRILQVVERLQHPRLHVFYGENRGIAYNRRFLTEHSQSEFVVPLDDDDMLAPDCVEKFLAFVRAHPWAGIVRARRDFIDESGNPVESEPWFPFEPRLFQHGALSDIFNHSQPNLISRAAYRRTDGWEGFADFRNAGEDCDVYIKIEEVAPIELLDDTLYHYRLSDRRTSLVLTDEAAFEMWRRLADKAIARIGLPVKRVSDRPPFAYERLARPALSIDAIDVVLSPGSAPLLEQTSAALVQAGVTASQVHRADGKSRSEAINAAFRTTSRPFVAFVEAGVIVDRAMLDALIEAFQHGDADVISAPVVSAPANPADGPLLLLARREVIKATGGFDEAYGDAAAADFDLLWQARRRDFVCVESSVQVMSQGPPAAVMPAAERRLAGKWREYPELVGGRVLAAEPEPVSNAAEPIAVEPPAPRPELPDDYQAAFKSAHEFLAARRFADAEFAFARVAELAPQFSWAYYGLGDTYSRQQRWTDAAAAYRQAIERNPDEPWAHHHLGNALSQLRAWAEAASAFERSLALDPSIADNYRNLGFARVRLEQWADAVAALAAAAERLPKDFWTHYCLGESLLRLERWPEAITPLETAVGLDSHSVWAARHLATALLQSGRSNEAIEHLKRCVEENPADTGALAYLGDALTRNDRAAEAVALLTPAADGHPSEYALHVTLGEAYGKLRDWTNAAASYARAAAASGAPVWVLVNHGHALTRAKHYDAAVDAYRRALAVEPDNLDVLRSLGVLFQQIRRTSDAIECFRRATELDPAEASWHAILGNALFQQRRYAEAGRAYERAIELQPDVAIPYAHLGNCFYEMERWDEAVRAYRRAIELQPSDSSLTQNLANALFKLSRWEDAITAYDTFLAHAPRSYWALHMRGDAMVKCGRFAAAVESLERAIAESPEAAWSHNYLGDAYGGLQKWEEAAAAYRRAAELEPTMWWAHNSLGEMLVRLGRQDEALQSFERAVATCPDASTAHHNVGDALSRAGRYADAAAAYQKADGLMPPWTQRPTGAAVETLQAWIESLAGSGASRAAGKRGLLFVVDTDYGELTTIMYLLLGQEALAGRSTLLLPPRLFANNANVLPGRTRVYGSPADVHQAIEELDPEVVFLCAGYLYSIHNLFSIDELGSLVARLRARGCGVVTMDPFLDLIGGIGSTTTISIHIPEWSPPQLVRAKEEQDARLIDNFTRSHEVLRDLPHLYPSYAAPPGRTAHPRQLSFFNSSLAGVPALDGTGEPPQWLFVLASRDYEVQIIFNGREWVMDQLAKKLEETVAAGRHPVFIGPYDCIQSLIQHFADQGGAVVESGVTLLTFCAFPKYSALLLNAEYAFYWNVLSHSMFVRLFNGRPVFQFDKGHLVRNVTPLYERIIDWYYQGWEPVFLDQAAPLELDALGEAAARYRAGAASIAPHFRRAPSPEQLIEHLRPAPAPPAPRPRRRRAAPEPV